MIEHKTILLKQLHAQVNKAVINSADSCPNIDAGMRCELYFTWVKQCVMCTRCDENGNIWVQYFVWEM